MDQNILVISFPRSGFKLQPFVTFQRREFSQILSLYGRMVSAGFWCDYAMGSFSDRAVFSVFQPNNRYPAYRIIKSINQNAPKRAFSIAANDGAIIRRGSHLNAVLRIFQRKLIRLVN